MSAAAIIRAASSEPVRPWPRHALDVEGWRGLAQALAEDTTLEFLALWADTERVHALFVEAGGAVLPASVPVIDGSYPALSPHRPGAAWFERAVHDLWGHIAVGGGDLRPWLEHGRWPNHAPMAPRPRPAGSTPDPPEFLSSQGEDLHQVPLGPVHGGINEPGHFRITAEGETILRLEVRLGYAHKGILMLMRGKPPRAAARYAARLSGDSTVAHSLAYARAAEAALAIDAPPRAHALRGVMAELERVANHLGDIGGIIEAAGSAFLPARFGWHREAILQACAQAFEHRLMMDCIVPGGVAADIATGGGPAILRALDTLEQELPALRCVFDDSGVVDRLVGTGVVSGRLAACYAAGGVVGRAAGRRVDARRSPGYPPYEALDFAVPVLSAGDADARVRIRLTELRESARLLRGLLASLPGGPLTVALPTLSGEGIGVAEGFRGDIWHWLRLDGGLIAAAFPRDPSWLQWPLLEAAAAGSVAADFPVVHRSFNATCSGVDL